MTFKNKKLFHILNERARKDKRDRDEELQAALEERLRRRDQHAQDGGGRIRPLIEDEE